jgi:hypothetical protein
MGVVDSVNSNVPAPDKNARRLSLTSIERVSVLIGRLTTVFGIHIASLV